jgi:putative salt-induced outer membrane protein YdiY
MSRLFMALLALFLALPSAGIAQDSAQESESKEQPESEEAPDVVKLQQEVYWAPPGAGNDGFTWIRLKSGEWVRGEIMELLDGTLTFDSDELDVFDYDWEDVRGVVSGKLHTITTWENEVLTGFIVARRGEIRVMDGEGALVSVVPLEDIANMIQGRPRERNYWRGSLSIGTNARIGNSEQSDLSGLFNLTRRALFTRWDNTLNLSWAAVQRVKTQETHRYTSKFDWFVARNWFVTLTEYEYYRDPFQNIRQRHIPGAGIGYDRNFGPSEWDATAGLAWQYIEFVSVKEGENQVEQELTGRLGSNLVWEITDDFEFDLNYSINFPFKDFTAHSSNMLAVISLDLFRNLDFDITTNWDRQNKPREAEDGAVPKKDDVRFSLGLGWEF